MKLGAGVVLLSLFLAATSATRIGRNTEDNDDDKECFDWATKSITKFVADTLDKLDPLVMPDWGMEINKTVLLLKVYGIVKMHDGYINGLSSLGRIVKCSKIIKDGNECYQVVISAGPLEGNYGGTVGFMNIKQTIKANIKLPYVGLTITFCPEAKGKKLEIEIHEIKAIEIKVSGLGPLNWALDQILSFFKPHFLEMFESILKNFLIIYFEEIEE